MHLVTHSENLDFMRNILFPHIKLGGKMWGKIQPNSSNKRKNLGKFCHKKMEKLGKILILGSHLKFRQQNLGYLLPILLEAKFGALTRTSEASFGAKPPNLLI